jgi:hypothetical protein
MFPLFSSIFVRNFCEYFCENVRIFEIRKQLFFLNFREIFVNIFVKTEIRVTKFREISRKLAHNTILNFLNTIANPLGTVRQSLV